MEQNEKLVSDSLSSLPIYLRKFSSSLDGAKIVDGNKFPISVSVKIIY
jgi:hypothetical protein